jgi:multiple sugar transport system ATP-binding protein
VKSSVCGSKRALSETIPTTLNPVRVRWCRGIFIIDKLHHRFMAHVSVKGLTKVYNTGLSGEIKAVDDISFEIDNGEILTLVGPSGCGKTTVLRSIAGLVTPTAGEVYFDGELIVGDPPQDRNISMMFQEVALWGHMPVARNIGYGLELDGVDPDIIRDRIEELASNLQISDQLDQNIGELSGGQQQRVALARAMIQDPALFLFDEPMSDLDAALKKELRPLIQKSVKRIGAPAIYVTHDQEEALTLSDKIAVMRDGKIEQFDTPVEIYRDPANEFVGKFIGSPQMNFVQVEPRVENGTAVVELEGMTYRFSERIPSTVKLGIRPHFVQVQSESHDRGIPAQHTIDEPMGENTHSHFDTDYGEFIAVTPAEFQGDSKQYKLTFEEEGLRLFDADGDALSIPA